VAEEYTRKLLKVFGVAVTDFEDRCQQICQQARQAIRQEADLGSFLPLLEGLARSTSEVTQRLLEVTQAVIERHNRTCAELLQLLNEAKQRNGPST
jgi:hypothetical protein